jgi:pyruvate dehydrogenase E2 component (dihydrolipoamide acetyltransferase)
MAELRMPSLGADMDAGTIVEWRIEPGDEIRRGDIVAVVDTDKADIDMESFESGVVERILVPVGERVAVGTPLAVIGSAGAPVPECAVPPVAQPLERPVAQPAAQPVEEVSLAAPPRVEAAALSPLLRRLARHLGVDLGAVHGTGPGGRVTREDVEGAARGQPAAVPEPAPTPTPASAVARERPAERPAMRDAIAALMSRSAREIPHYHVAADIDLGPAMAWLAQYNLAQPVGDRLLPVALLLKATALAARAAPELNGFWVDGRYCAADGVHLGVATSLRSGGLVAPAIHDVDKKDLATVMRELRDLVARARTGRLRSSEMSDPTLTVTNLGEQGVDVVHGLIYPPQVALVGFGCVRERPWARDGMLGVRPVVTASLAADHRATDGMRGARFLRQIDELLQEPDQL